MLNKDKKCVQDKGALKPQGSELTGAGGPSWSAGEGSELTGAGRASWSVVEGRDGRGPQTRTPQE